MAKARTKKRTHKTDPSASEDVPKTMVVHTSAGTTGKSLAQLTKDIRLMMAPHTAARLKERKNNKLRDYTTMAGPLGVSHLLLLNQSATCPTLRIARTPHGPTLFFRIKEYSLTKDLSRAVRNPKSPGPEFNHAPLLVMNNFSTTSSKDHPEEELLRTTFQNLFPALDTSTATVHTMRRVVLVHRHTNAPDSDIELRHYAISTRVLGQDRRVRKIRSGEKRRRGDGVPNLGALEDVSEFLLSGGAAGGYESASESEVEEDSKFDIAVPAKRKHRSTSSVSAKVKREGSPSLDLAGEYDGTIGHRNAEGDENKDENEEDIGMDVDPREVDILEVSEDTKQQDILDTSSTPKPPATAASSTTEQRGVKLVELGPRLLLQLAKITADISRGQVLYHSTITLTAAESARQRERYDAARQVRDERRAEQAENVRRKRRASGVHSDEDENEDEDENIDEDEDAYEDEGEVGDQIDDGDGHQHDSDRDGADNNKGAGNMNGAGKGNNDGDVKGGIDGGGGGGIRVGRGARQGDRHKAGTGTSRSNRAKLSARRQGTRS